MGSQIFLIIIFMFLSAFFSSIETAYSTMSRIKLKTMANNGSKTAHKVLKITEEQYTRAISTILVGNNIVNIMATALFTVLSIRIFGENNGAFFSTLISTVALLFFCEITPKTIAKEIPETIALVTYVPFNFFMIILTPVTFIFDIWKSFINLFIASDQKRSLKSDEMIVLVNEAKEDGQIDGNEADLITNAIEFNDLDVSEILTPRTQLVAIDINDSNETIDKVFRENNYSRIPVYEDTIDNVIGILQEKDFYYKYLQKKEINLRDLIVKPYFTTVHVKIKTLLRQLQKNKNHIAIVIDEFGGTEGIVTMEDILEELVGEIYDEHDDIEELFKKVSDNEYIVDGDYEVKHLTDKLQIGVSDEKDIITTSGFIVYMLEKTPEVNDSFEYEGYRFTIIDTDNKTVNKAKIEKL